MPEKMKLVIGDKGYRVVNEANGMLLGFVTHDFHTDSLMYESLMPQSRGQKWHFTSKESLDKWLKERYPDTTKTPAPKVEDKPE